MRREPLPFYPLVIAALPVVSVYATNLAYVPAAQVVRPLGIAVGAAAALTALLSLAFRNAARGAAAAAVAFVCLFAYGWFADRTQPFFGTYGIPPKPVWGLLTLALAGLAAWRIRQTKILNVLAAFIALIAVFNLGANLVRSSQLAQRAPRGEAGKSASVTKPDVFYMILDGHGRQDAIRRAIGYDDTPFIEGLRKRGFYVADRSRSNYCQTELSLASSLNMDTIPHLLPKVSPKTDDRFPLERLIDDNEVARRFRAQGYRFVAVTSGFPPVSFPSADLQLGTRWGGTMVESTLLQMTPLVTDGTIESMFDARRQNLVGAFDNLGSLATPTPQPRFVMVHILAPHPPFVFTADGSPRPRTKGPFGYQDGSDFTSLVGSPEGYLNGYAGQVAWVEGQTLKAIDGLLAGEGKGHQPIIIVQGDHGSKLHLDQDSLARTDLKECFPNLNAYLVPGAIQKDLRPDLTPVNSFRIVLHGLFGDDLPQLPDRSWYSTFPLPYAFTDVTDRVEPVTGHAAPPSPQ